MIAAIISRFGPPDVLELRDVPAPVPQSHDVLVRVRASALNRADLLQRIGRYPPPSGVPADIGGIEFAGEVAAVGDAARQWSVGDRVFGLTGGGAHAQFLVAHEATVARIPDGVSWHEAAAFPEAFITAYDALVTQAGVSAGERVLVHAVGSGVGLAAVQVARAWGAIPYGTSRTADKVEQARAYGLEDGVTLTLDRSSLPQAVAAWSEGRGMDIVLDLVGGPYVEASIEVAASKGRIMLIGAIAGSQATIDVRRVLGKRLTLRGTVLRARPLDEKIAVTAAFARDLVPRLERRELRSTIDSVFPLTAIADAHRRMESNETVGKVVVDIGSGDR